MAVHETSVDQLADQLNRGVVLIDVRNEDEYAQAHIPGAQLIPLPTLADRLDELPRDTWVAVICQSGGRSAQAAELLGEAGIDATSVTGGTTAWIESGRPTDKSSPPE